MIIKLLHKYQDGGHRIIDAEKDDYQKFASQYIQENKGNVGKIEVFIKGENGDFIKVDEYIIEEQKTK